MPNHAHPDTPKLSIVVPAYNEAKRLPATVAAVCGAMAGWDFSCELVLVDDGSSDGTGELIAELARTNPRIVAVSYAPNRGKGGAVIAGVAASRGGRVIFFDADLSYPLAAVPEALERLERAPLCVGARDLDPEGGRAEYSATRKLTSFVFNAFVGLFLRLGVRDTQCGFKGFHGDVARRLFPHLAVTGFGFDVELLFLARRFGLAIDRMPIRMVNREGSSVSVLRHSLQMARDVLRIRWRAWTGRYPKQLP
jgi:dolichyl-phosphate beta-glucosyltransferase